MFVIQLLQRFDQQKIPYLLVGGYALAFHGIVRATMNVDLVVNLTEKQLLKAEQVLKDMGLESRLPIRAKDIAQFHEEYRLNRNLIAWSFVDYKDPSRQVDLLIYPPIKSLKSELISVHNFKIRLATKHSLLEMKRLSNRPEDQMDIQRLLEAILDEEK